MQHGTFTTMLSNTGQAGQDGQTKQQRCSVPAECTANADTTASECPVSDFSLFWDYQYERNAMQRSEER